MKYIKLTLKYVTSNLLLLPCYVVAIICFALIINPAADHLIIANATSGQPNNFYNWFAALLLFNPLNWSTYLSGIIAYAVLICDLAFIHSLVDKHVRFGSKSFRSITNGFNINVCNGLILAVFAIVLHLLATVIFAAVMTTCEALMPPYSYILGILICLIFFVALSLAASLFLMWLPCVEVTGFKKYEALLYAYALARQRMKGLFVSFSIPLVIVTLVSLTVSFLTAMPVAFVVVPILCGTLFIYFAVLSYIAYADAEGIEREDLKKY
jgi:hypothetical protein